MTDEISLNMRGGGKVQRADISMLRIVSTLAVLMIHTCNTITNNFTTFNPTDFQYKILVTFNSLANWGVPMFFMLTGTLLLRCDKKIGYKDCICKYSKRILLALFLFGIPFACLEIFAETRIISLFFILESFARVISGKSWGHLWYLYELIGLYMILPVVKAFTDRGEKDIQTALGILFLFNLLIQTLNSINNMIGFYLPIRTSAVFYLILGRYLDEQINCVFYKYKKLLFFAAVVMTIVISLAVPRYSSVVLGYSSPITAILVAAIYCNVKGFKSNGTKFLWNVDRLCFSVYLCHPLFTNFVYKFLGLSPLMFGNCIIVGIILFWILFLICGFICAKVLNMIPVLRKNVL